MGLMGFNGHAIVRPLDFKPLDHYLTRIRTCTGIKLIPKEHAMRKIITALRKGELVGILLDQSAILREGVFVDFFGHRACTDKGMAGLALKIGTPVVPMFGLRLKEGHYRILIKPEIELIRSGDKTRDIEDNTALFTRVIEDVIRTYPEHVALDAQTLEAKAILCMAEDGAPDEPPQSSVRKKDMETTGINNILIRGTNWVGDAIMTTPALAAVRNNFPHARISMLAAPWVAKVFEYNPCVDEVILYEREGRHSGLKGKIRLIGELKSRGFDLAILFQNAFEAAFIAWGARNTAPNGVQYRWAGTASYSSGKNAAGVQEDP